MAGTETIALSHPITIRGEELYELELPTITLGHLKGIDAAALLPSALARLVLEADACEHGTPAREAAERAIIAEMMTVAISAASVIQVVLARLLNCSPKFVGELAVCDLHAIYMVIFPLLTPAG